MTEHCDAIVQDGESIQAAVDAADVGDTICVETGTYEEEVIVTVDELSLVAADGHEPVLDGEGELGTALTISNRSNVTVDGFEVRDYSEDVSVLVDDAWGTTLSNTDIIHPDFGTTGGGISIRSSPEVTIDNCLIEDHSSGDGIEVDASRDVRIENSTVSDNAGTAGVLLDGSASAEIKNNTILGNGGDGIRARVGSDEALIEGNDIESNWDGNGILLFEVDDVEIRENTIQEHGDREILINDAPGAVVDDNHIVGTTSNSSPGILIIGLLSEGCTISNNHISDNGNEGIRVEDANQVLIERNTIENNNQWSSNQGAVRLMYSEGTTVVDNTITDNAFRGLYVIGGDTSTEGVEIENNTVESHDVDVHVERMDACELRDNTFETGLVFSGETLSHFDHVVENNTAQGDQIFFANGEDDPTIPSDASQVIIVDSTNVEVSGESYSDVAAGIQVAYCDGVTVEDNTLTDMAGDRRVRFVRQHPPNLIVGPRGGSVNVWGSDNATVTNNTVTTTGWNGITVVASTDATLEHNEVTECETHGIYFYASLDALVRDNTTNNNGNPNSVGSGIYFGESANGAEIRENETRLNDNHGIRTLESNSIHIEDNVASDNDGAGIALTDVIGATITANETTGNESNGIGVGTREYDESSDVTITNNDKISGNDGHGIRLDTNTIAEVSDNDDISNNSRRGISVPHEDCVVTRNTVTGGEIGIRSSGDFSSGGPTIDDNTVTGCTEYGIEFWREESGTIENNTIENCGIYGIHLYEVENVDVLDNDASNNPFDLRLFESEGTTVEGNAFTAGVGFQWGFGEPMYFDHTFANNTVQNDPLFYAFGVTDPDVPETAGQVLIGNSSDVTITGQTFDGVSAPIHVAYCDDVDVSGVTGKNSPTDGILVDEVPAISVTETEISESESRAIALDAEEGAGAIVLDDITVTDSETGIDLEGHVESFELRNSAIRDNEEGLVIHDDATAAVIEDNNIEGNDIGLHYDRWADRGLDVTENWWGAADGPSGDVEDYCVDTVADGSGDAIHEDSDDRVCFDPWLEEVYLGSGVEGAVTDTDGTALEDVVIEAANREEITDETGAYSIQLEPDEYEVSADAFGYEKASETVTVTEDQFTQEDFTLDEELDGRVTTPQPDAIESGETLETELEAAHAETVTVSQEGEYAESDAILEIDETEASFDDPVAVADDFTEVTISVETAEDTSGDVSLSVTLAADDEDIVLSTGTTTVYEEFISVGVVDVSDTYDETIADVLTTELDGVFDVEKTSTVDVIADPASYDVVVAQSLDNDEVGNFVDTTETDDIGVVYLDQWWSLFGGTPDAAQALPQLSEESDEVSETFQDNGDDVDGPVSYQVSDDHPILDGWSVGDDQVIHESDTDDATWFDLAEDADFDVIADIRDTAEVIGSGLAVDEGTNTVLAATLGYSANVGEDDFTDAADTILAGAVEHLADVDAELSVSIADEAIDHGENAVLSISAEAVEELIISKLWADWVVLDEGLDGGTATDEIATDGTYRIEWSGVQESVSISLTVELPEATYVGGIFGLEATADNDESDEARDTGTIEIQG